MTKGYYCLYPKGEWDKTYVLEAEGRVGYKVVSLYMKVEYTPSSEPRKGI